MKLVNINGDLAVQKPLADGRKAGEWLRFHANEDPGTGLLDGLRAVNWVEIEPVDTAEMGREPDMDWPKILAEMSMFVHALSRTYLTRQDLMDLAEMEW